MLNKKYICCEKMMEAVSSINEIPINAEPMDNGKIYYAIERYTPFNPDVELIEENLFSSIQFCPFCGKKVSIFPRERSGNWKHRKRLCFGFLLCGIVRRKEQVEMIEYDHRNNQLYLHKRRGFGDGLIPITYCIFCGENVGDMISKYGIPNEMKECLHPDEWWKKRGL